MEGAANQPPSGQQSDSLELREAADISGSPVTYRVYSALAAMNATGDDVEERYQAILASLREEATQAVIVMARLECELPRWDYSGRWAVVYLLGAMEHPAALPLLREIVLMPIPPEQSKDPHSSTVAEETIIRTTAVDAVAALAREGHEEALEALSDFFEIPSFSIRRAAAQGLLATPRGDDYVDRIRACLPKDQHFVLELKKQDVRKVEQIEDPTTHLKEQARGADKPAAPDITDRSAEDRSIFQGKRMDVEFRDADSDDYGESPTGREPTEED